MKPPASERGRWFGPPALPAAAALLFAALFQAAAFAAQPDTLRANLLTRDLGDPREPGNAKLVMTLPESSGHLVASARAEDFVVHIYPEELSESEGTVDRYRADGLYLWRYKARLFLDVREVPRQDNEGKAKVRVSFAPGGRVRATGMAEGECRYASDLVDVVLAVDVSRSMNYNDPRKRRVAAARTFLEMAREGGGIGRVGLVTFNHRGDVATPLVSLDESDRLLGDLNKVGADGLTNLDIPLGLAERMFRESGSRRSVVVLLTDGKNEGTRYQNTHRRLAADGIRIFTVGLTESADHGLLQEMADASDGMYFRAPSDSDLPEIYARLAAELGKRHLLRGDLLPSASGSGSIPIDATVRRIAAIADGGARVNLSDPLGAEVAGGGSGRIGSVYVGRPKAGVWNYSWNAAEAGVSGLGFFGDTPFFLDLFPPQYQGDRMAVGATLGRGASPFPSGEVWLEALPGVPGGRIVLYDDGLHDDGQAGDGVYGTVVDLPPEYRDRFGVTVRADGELPEDGAFVRQTAGIAVRMPIEPEPEIKRFSLEGGDIDFGVLFPGESGVAEARIDYEGRTSENFLFDLSWPETAGELPSLFSRVDIAPGRQVFELEIAVPHTAVPGHYRGVLDVRADSGLGDAKTARLLVGDVRLTDPGIVDLGALRPGDDVDYVITVPYYSDKPAFLEIAAMGEDLLSVAADRDMLDAGAGELRLAVTASASPDARDGERAARIALRAGPAALEIPVQWRVQAFRGATIGGDVDFGVLFPGETGHADVSVDLDSTRPERLSFNLAWPETAGSLPGLSIDNMVEPGRQGFTLDIAVPNDAPLGPHRGAFAIRAENGLGDLREAKVTVGTVVLGDPGPLVLGEIRPGESVERMVTIPYRADKAVSLAVAYDGDREATIASDAESLAHGEGTLILRVAAASAADAEDGDRSGTIVLTAGPARLEIPTSWSVRGFRGALLGDDLDFGVVFPGETGTAEVVVNLDSTRPERLFFNLTWPENERSFPAMASDDLIPPGRQAFELDLPVADNVRPGDYEGRFAIRAWNGLGDERLARLKVGTVVFGDVDAIDLGAIRPGSSAERTIRLRYRADKEAALFAVAEGMELAVSVDTDRIDEGDGEFDATIVAAIGADALDGEREGLVRITAGPGTVAIPVRWSVRSFWGAALGDDADFGVLFPGETGTASVDVVLDSARPETLDFSLIWPDAGGALPELSSRATLLPGRHPHELEIVVPADARPAAHAGRFEIRSESGLGDVRSARLVVGAVEFADPGAVDFGEIKPGESATRRLSVAYRADKPANLTVLAENGGALAASSDVPALAAGEGRINLDVSLTLPPEADDRPAVGKVILSAGPGRLEVPVFWNVRGFQSAKLDSDVDFGVVFPGETARAEAPLALISTRPETLTLDLSWPNVASFLPSAHFDQQMSPGRRIIELELPIPADAPLGQYQGRFSIGSANGGPGDSRPARIRIGTVRLDGPGELDMGDVPPGTFVAKTVDVTFDADRGVGLTLAASGDPVLSATPSLEFLPAGRGGVAVEVIVSAPIGSADGPRSGVVTLWAGPGIIEIPVAWNVRAYAPDSGNGDHRPGVDLPFSLPDPEQVAPVLPDPQTGSYRPETYFPDSGRMPARRLDDSPLDRTRAAIDDALRRPRGEERLRDGDRPWRDTDTTPAGLDDGGKASESGDGSWWPWNAWWLYLLAALLLLLLLLLLIAYILYKLRKKALLLLAAIIANLILLAIFIALLSSSVWIGGAIPPPIEVNLVEMDNPERYGLTPRLEDTGATASLEPLDNLRESDDAGGSGAGSSDSLLAELAGAASAAGASGSPLNRPDELPGEAEATGELAAEGTPVATAVAMERTTTSPRRRERRAEREARDLPHLAMPELAEPPPSQPANVADANATAESREVVGERVDVDELVDPGAPAWSGDVNGPEVRAGDPAQLSTEAMEMEFVAREPTLATAEPRGRRRNRDQAPSLAMEPRVLIDDPVRDNTEKIENVDMSRERQEADFGIEEMRIDSSAGGTPSMAQKAAGPAIPAGSSELASGDQAHAVEGVRESAAEPNRSSRRERQTNRESGGPPVRSPSTLTADASGAGQRPARPAGGPGTISSGESRFESGPGGLGDALDGAEAPGGDRLGMELADAGRPGSLAGTDDSGRASGRTGLKSSDGRSGGASEPGTRGGRGRRGGRAGDGLGDRDHGDGDGRGTGTTGPGAGSSGTTPGGGAGQTGPGGTGEGGDRGDGRGGDKGDGRGYGSGRGSGSGDREGRVDDLGPYGGGSSLDPAGLRIGDRDASSLDDLEGQSTMRFPSPGRVDTDWERGEMRQRRRRGVAPASSVDRDALLIVLGDFVTLSDDAPRNLFAVLAERLAPNVDVEERILRPGDRSLADCLLTIVTPAEVEKWTESELRSAAAYMRSGGHIWLDSENRNDNERALRLLAGAAGGEVRALPAGHQLADSGSVDGLFVAPAGREDLDSRDILGVVATSFGWRERWRYGDGDAGTLRFLVRTLNLFLSGDADVGLSVDVAEGKDGLAILGTPPVIPEMVIGIGTGATTWEDHRSGGDSRWRLPSWSDKADLSVVSDGKGGRALRLDLGAAERGRVSVYRVMSPPEDFSEVGRMTIDVYYGGNEGEAALSTVITAPESGQWVDFETRPQPLERGWNRIELRPAADRFRSAITGWQEYDARPSELDRLGRLGIILYRDGQSAEVLLLGQIDLFESVPD